MKTLKISLFVVTLLVLLILVTSCFNDNVFKENSINSVDNFNNQSDTLTSSIDKDKLYFELVEKLIEEKKSENIVISPISIDYALLLFANGANDSTKKEVLNYLGGDLESLNTEFSEYLSSLNSSLRIANSIWFNEPSVNIKEDYRIAMEDDFHATIEGVDFSKGETKDLINDWINEETDGLIPKIATEFSPDTIMTLINALYFDENWMEEFISSATKPENFYVNNAAVTVDMMKGKVYDYLETDEVTGFIKYYMNPRYAFVAILPKNESYSLKDINFNELLSSKESIETRIKMPSFKVEFNTSLNNYLKEYGIRSMFDVNDCNLDNMFVINSKNPFVSSVLHQNVIDVSEHGTRAASATTIVTIGASFNPNPQYKEVILNKPFDFVIMDMEYNKPLFIGHVENPNN